MVGPNGAGKTTLFKIIAGILKPSSGSVHVHGHQPGRHLCVAYVPQRSEVDWEFPVSVHDVVMMGRIREMGLFRWPRRVDRARVQEALQAVGMETLADRQIGDLSGGQQQRTFLAQAVAQEAKIVLLDEPLSGLDLPSQEAILDIMQNLHARGVTVLVATHDLKLAHERFDCVLLLNRRLISFGAPAKALNREALLEAYSGQLHEIAHDGGRSILIDNHLGGKD